MTYGARAVAYRGARAILSRRYGAKAYRAANVIRRAWKYRRPLMRVARYAYRAAKRRKTGPERRLVKVSKTKSQATAQAFPSTSSTHNIQTLHFAVIPYPKDPDTFLDIGANGYRRGQDIYLKGVKICRHFHITNDNSSWPHMVHWALVQHKENDERQDAIEGSLRRQFFRVHNDANQKTLNFDDNTANWNQIYNCAPMNPDGDWNILTHWKMRLEPAPGRGATGMPSTKWLKTVSKYYKLRTPVHFQNKLDDPPNSRSDDIPNNPVYEVWWFSAIMPQGHSATQTLQSAAYNTTYYSNKH